MVAGGVHGTANTRLHDGARQSRGRSGQTRPNNPVTGVVSSFRARDAERYAGSDYTSKPDGQPLPFAKRKGTRASEASSQGMPIQGSGERITYPAHVYPPRRAGEATALAGGKNSAMAGARFLVLPAGPPVWRRRGRWIHSVNYKQPIARDPNHAAMIRPIGFPRSRGNVRRTKGAANPRLNAPKPKNYPFHAHPCNKPTQRP